MRISGVTLLALTIAFSGSAQSEKADSSAKGLVESGLIAYQKGGASEALKVWVKGSAMEGNPQALTQANSLRQIEDFYGKPIGYDVVKEYDAGPRVKIVYFTINYEKGVAFGAFQAYRNSAGQWVSTLFKFHTDAGQVFPQCLFSG